MENTASITAKMAAFGRAFYAENAANPVFTDAKGKELIGEEEYRAMEAWIRQGVDFFLPGKNDCVLCSFCQTDTFIRISGNFFH